MKGDSRLWALIAQQSGKLLN